MKLVMSCDSKACHRVEKATGLAKILPNVEKLGPFHCFFLEKLTRKLLENLKSAKEKM